MERFKVALLPALLPVLNPLPAYSIKRRKIMGWAIIL